MTGECLVGLVHRLWDISILIIRCDKVVGRDIARAIADMETQVGRISPVQKFLLGTDGSVTQILESITGKKVVIRTLVQKVVPADRAAADNLSIAEGDPVNFRIVEIMTEESGEVLIYATSHTPINRLSPAFKDDLMKADIPIGRIIKQHHIEARREILSARVTSESYQSFSTTGKKRKSKKIIEDMTAPAALL